MRSLAARFSSSRRELKPFALFLAVAVGAVRIVRISKSIQLPEYSTKTGRVESMPVSARHMLNRDSEGGT
jgi:hypothetical protein